ncbi:hypothetical protein SK128_005571 [Halocaridina rubra]|uniref:Uncharacterized protein n=1 Tax=Halocaridina rubra TaxID=373956 RepID=A0AAN8WES3_HALRR
MGCGTPALPSEWSLAPSSLPIEQSNPPFCFPFLMLATPQLKGETAKEHDDNMARSVTFCNLLDDAMTPYKTIFQRKKKQRKQLPITMFFSPKKHP